MMTLNLANEATEPLFSDIVMKTQGDITPPQEKILSFTSGITNLTDKVVFSVSMP